jgi:hypothetical protein
MGGPSDGREQSVSFEWGSRSTFPSADLHFDEASLMLSSAAAATSRFYHSVVPRRATTRTEASAPAVAAMQRTREEQFIHDFQKAVVKVKLEKLTDLVNAAPAGHLRAAVNRVIPMGPPHVKPGDTPLHALASRHTCSTRAGAMISLLLRAQADPNAVNDAGQTPAMRAFAKHQYPQLRALAHSPRYDPNTPMPEALGRMGAQPETLLQRAYATDDYQAQHILEAAGDGVRLAALRQVFADTDEAGDVMRVLAQAGNAPPSYSARLQPPTYDEFIAGAGPQAEAARPVAPSAQEIALLRRSRSA